jgi:hypothetical protein
LPLAREAVRCKSKAFPLIDIGCIRLNSGMRSAIRLLVRAIRDANCSFSIRPSAITTGNGSALVENLTNDGVPAMTSVYHLDGADLRLTHFCGAQNQPRLKATTIDSDGGQITFSLVDITNLRTPTTGHVHDLEVRFLESGHITLKFRFVGDGKDSDELVDLRRKK